jgi:hypothetical protein
MTEPIIPVQPGGGFQPWFRQLVPLTDVDVAVNVDAPPEDAAAAAAALGLDVIPLANIDIVGLSAFCTHPSATGPATHEEYIHYVIPQDAALWEVVGAGDLTTEHQSGLTAEALMVIRAGSDAVACAQVNGSTLVERTCAQFGENWMAGTSPNGPAVVWVTEPNSFWDCLYFWNLRTLRPLRLAQLPMLIIPAGAIQNWANFRSQFLRSLERPDEFAPDVVLRSASDSVPEAILDETASLLRLERCKEKPRTGFRVPAPIRKAPFSYLVNLDPRSWLTFERSYGEITDVEVQVFREKTTVRFSSPVKFRGTGKALVRIDGEALDGLPRRPEVANLIQAGSTWHKKALQITAFAVNDYRFELHIPELPAVIKTLLGERAARHELSPKGKPGMVWLDRTDVNPLLEAYVFSAIRELTTPRIKRLARELQKIRSEGAADEDIVQMAANWGGRMERSYKSAGQLAYVPGEARTQTLERLCNLGWAERGLRLNCGQCGLHNYVPLPQTSGRAVCPGCNSPGEYETSSTLTVYYRLNSYLDFLSDQGILPHLITIAALTKAGTNSHFLPGIDMWFSDGGKGEADVFGIRDGQVLSGEVKTSGAEFTDEQIIHDVDLSLRIGADAHIMAVTDAISQEARNKASQECETRGLSLIVLQKDDLLPVG